MKFKAVKLIFVLVLRLISVLSIRALLADERNNCHNICLSLVISNDKKLMNQISDIIIRLKFLSVEILKWEWDGFFTDVSTSITNTGVNEMYIIEQEAS
ncbi:hypothetical protein T09_13420 [Trichinella sp. T9]|nr:hypothetical protein T09_13420 [Trichinella sp. T9]